VIVHNLGRSQNSQRRKICVLPLPAVANYEPAGHGFKTSFFSLSWSCMMLDTPDAGSKLVDVINTSYKAKLGNYSSLYLSSACSDVISAATVAV
jgi:hypothetical protein